MNPIHSSTFEGITCAVRRHYLRPLTLEATSDPNRWRIQIEHRTDPLPTEVVRTGERFTFQTKARAPQWDKEIPNENH